MDGRTGTGRVESLMNYPSANTHPIIARAKIDCGLAYANVMTRAGNRWRASTSPPRLPINAEQIMIMRQHLHVIMYR